MLSVRWWTSFSEGRESRNRLRVRLCRWMGVMSIVANGFLMAAPWGGELKEDTDEGEDRSSEAERFRLRTIFADESKDECEELKQLTRDLESRIRWSSW